MLSQREKLVSKTKTKKTKQKNQNPLKNIDAAFSKRRWQNLSAPSGHNVLVMHELFPSALHGVKKKRRKRQNKLVNPCTG